MYQSTLRFKVLSVGLLLAAIFTVVVGVKTVDAASLTSSQISAIISLLQSFGAEQSVINNVNSALTGSSPVSSSTTEPTSTCYVFSYNLKWGSRDSATSGEVSRLQKFLISQGYDVSVTGYFGTDTYRVLAKYQKAVGISPADGYFGPVTRAYVNGLNIGCSTQPSATITSPLETTSLTPTIYGTATGVSQVGVVLAGAYGDKVYGSGLIPVVNGKWSVTVSPALTVGQYFVYVFDVNNNKLTESQRLTINPVTPPSITVLSPNGGESWQKGTIQTIKWQDNITYPPCPTVPLCNAPAVVRSYDIKLAPYYPPCIVGVPCSAYPYNAPYTIAKSVAGLSYNWNVGVVFLSDDLLSKVSDGSYTVQVCRSGTDTCDYSNSYFKIASVSQDRNKIDLSSIFPYQSTPSCPTPEYVRAYTIPAFSYPVKIVAETNIHVDDYITINGESAWPVGINSDLPCGRPRLTSNGDQFPGYQLGQAIPAGTPITIKLIDTIGLESKANGILDIVRTTMPPTLPNPNAPTITISHPVASLVPGGQLTLQWSTTNTPSSTNVDVYLVGNNYSKKLGTGPNVGNLTVTIPSSATSGSNPYTLMAVIYVNGQSFTDMVGNLIVNSPEIPSITVLSPNGGEVLTSNVSTTIIWKSSNIAGFKVELNLHNIYNGQDSLFKTIAFDLSDTGSYIYKVDPSIPSGKYKISASLIDSNRKTFAADISDNYFTIASPIICQFPAPPVGCQYENINYSTCTYNLVCPAQTSTSTSVVTTQTQSQVASVIQAIQNLIQVFSK